ncbi:MAG: CD1247 N-terminal domain-containing protein [Christensenellales bacterium]|jgi:DNA-directed RNA polymerase subunit delta
MSYLTERMSFIHGLAEGMKIDDETDQGRFLMALVSVMEEIVETIDEIEEKNEELLDYLQMLEEKIGAWDEDREYEDAGDEEECDEDDFDEMAGALAERFESVECPECGEIVYFDRSMVGSENELICPECNTPITGLSEPEGDED